jgi:hypothetical protein
VASITPATARSTFRGILAPHAKEEEDDNKS